MYRVYIIEDDLTIAETVAAHLSKWDYDTKCASDFRNIIGEFTDFDPQLVLIDISLPFMNGYYWCAEIRKISKAPIVFISSVSDNMNIVMAMNMGADDFISKPFDLNVLSAKVGAMLRRAYSFGANPNLIEHKGLMLNLNDGTASYNNEKIELTKNDFKILAVLMENADKIVARDTLMLRLWESDSFIDDNTLTVNITRLRKKLEDKGLNGFIVTKKGLGYMV